MEITFNEIFNRCYFKSQMVLYAYIIFNIFTLRKFLLFAIIDDVWVNGCSGLCFYGWESGSFANKSKIWLFSSGISYCETFDFHYTSCRLLPNLYLFRSTLCRDLKMSIFQQMCVCLDGNSYMDVNSQFNVNVCGIRWYSKYKGFNFSHLFYSY